MKNSVDGVQHFQLPMVIRLFENLTQTLLDGCIFGQNRSIELLLVANCSAGQTQTSYSTTERKFSFGKTLLSGGVPMTKKVTSEEALTSHERDESLCLYSREQGPVLFNRAELDYTGLGDAMQMTRDLNFNRLKTVVRDLAPQAGYDDRLLKRAEQVRLLGPSLNPDTDIDLAFEILSRSLLS